jgi:hypothetical protein
MRCLLIRGWLLSMTCSMVTAKTSTLLPTASGANLFFSQSESHNRALAERLDLDRTRVIAVRVFLGRWSRRGGGAAS